MEISSVSRNPNSPSLSVEVYGYNSPRLSVVSMKALISFIYSRKGHAHYTIQTYRTDYFSGTAPRGFSRADISKFLGGSLIEMICNLSFLRNCNWEIQNFSIGYFFSATRIPVSLMVLPRMTASSGLIDIIF